MASLVVDDGLIAFLRDRVLPILSHPEWFNPNLNPAPREFLICSSAYADPLAQMKQALRVIADFVPFDIHSGPLDDVEQKDGTKLLIVGNYGTGEDEAFYGAWKSMTRPVLYIYHGVPQSGTPLSIISIRYGIQPPTIPQLHTMYEEAFAAFKVHTDSIAKPVKFDFPIDYLLDVSSGCHYLDVKFYLARLFNYAILYHDVHGGRITKDVLTTHTLYDPRNNMIYSISARNVDNEQREICLIGGGNGIKMPPPPPPRRPLKRAREENATTLSFD